MVAKWCQIRGAANIIGIDSVPERLELASKLGINIINYSEVNDVYKVLTKSYPDGIDVGIECVGFEYSKTFRFYIIWFFISFLSIKLLLLNIN
jgi:threonine dehydrogenase-like Zn-dependent dehydrogenase